VAAGAFVLVSAALLLHRPLDLAVAPDLAEAPAA
jgi:hypothetical protein